MAIARPNEDFHVRQLTEGDVAACYKLEVATFPPAERATLEKIQHRLIYFSAISLGLFNRDALVGHILATRTSNEAIRDEDMCVGPAEKHTRTRNGRTVCLQVLAIAPKYQRTGLGRKLLTEYLHRLDELGSTDGLDSVCLLAHDHLVPYYESFDFVNCGPSKCTFGDGGWNDLVRKVGIGGHQNQGH